MRWLVYNVLFAIAYAAMMPKFLRRMKKRGGYRAHFAERFGKYDPETARRLAGKPRVWIHAVSVGEANLAGTVIRELRRRKQRDEIWYAFHAVPPFALLGNE